MKKVIVSGRTGLRAQNLVEMVKCPHQEPVSKDLVRFHFISTQIAV